METQSLFIPIEPAHQLQHSNNQNQLKSTQASQFFNTNDSAQQLQSNTRPKDSVKSIANSKFNIFSKVTSLKKGHAFCKQKLLQLKIKKQFKEYAIKTPEIIDCIKNISKQIKSSILKVNNIGQKDISDPINQNVQSLNTCQINTNQGVMTFKMVEDHSVIRQNQLRNLLVPTQGDNDVSSDDEDLRKGMNYLFKELVYSVGQNYQQSKKKKQKRFKARQSNKQNDCSNINTQNHLLHQKKDLSRVNNYNQHSSTQSRLNIVKH